MKLAEMTIKEVNDLYAKGICFIDCKNCALYGGSGCILDYLPYFKWTNLKQASEELGFEIKEETTIKEIFMQLLERQYEEPKEETEDYEPDFDEDDNPLARMLHERGMKN